MKQLLLIVILGVISVYAQTNETVAEVADDKIAVSNETISIEAPEGSMTAGNEPMEAKQTVSLQSAEKPNLKDDDNSNVASNAMDTVGNAAKNAKQAVVDAAESTGNAVSNAAQNAADSASNAAASAEQDMQDTLNGSSPLSVAASLAVFALLFTSIRLF